MWQIVAVERLPGEPKRVIEERVLVSAAQRRSEPRRVDRHDRQQTDPERDRYRAANREACAPASKSLNREHQHDADEEDRDHDSGAGICCWNLHLTIWYRPLRPGNEYGA